VPDQSAASKLFEPFRLGASLLANRIVMAPMSRNRADDNDAATALTPFITDKEQRQALSSPKPRPFP